MLCPLNKWHSMASTEPLILAAKNSEVAKLGGKIMQVCPLRYRRTNCNKKDNQRYQLVPKKGLHLEQLTIDLINNGLIVIDPNGVVELVGKKQFYVMLNFTPNWILDKCNILQYFPYPHIVFRLNWIPQWIPLKSINARAGSDRICLKQKIPQKVFQSCPIIPTSWRQNILSHKICPGVNTQFDVKKLECGLYEMSRAGHKTYFGNFLHKKEQLC